jgi:transposase InsO family protein
LVKNLVRGFSLIILIRLVGFSFTNKPYRCVKCGLRCLAKIERTLGEQRNRQARRYNKNYPGQMLHGDTERLPMLNGQSSMGRCEYLLVTVDDFFWELYAAISPIKTQYAAKQFLEQVLVECPYFIEQYYTSNGKKYRGNRQQYVFMKFRKENYIEQRFSKPRNPKIDRKAEQVLGTIMQMWYRKIRFKSSAHRQTELKRFVNYYNTVKPHRSIANMTPLEKLIDYFYPEDLQTTCALITT